MPYFAMLIYEALGVPFRPRARTRTFRVVRRAMLCAVPLVAIASAAMLVRLAFFD
jgi:hypothetical protein